jgi:uncharacterized protein YlxW (UPF0749 family)
MHKRESRIILSIILFILGIALALQFKSTLYAKHQNSSNALNAEKLMAQLVNERKETDALKAAIDENLKVQDEIINAYYKQGNDYQLSSDLDYIKLVAGLVDVSGPGITIKLDDAPVRQPDTPVNWLIIHDEDIKIILNELKSAGAQAISVNGERVMPMSEQVCAGPNILINGNKYPVPYIINAIGDPDLLYESISRSERIAEMMQFKIRVEITKSREILIPKYSGSADLQKQISGLEEVGK